MGGPEPPFLKRDQARKFTPPPIQVYPTPNWWSREAWQQIQIGMSSSQVESILGKPTSIESYVFPTYFYRGSVGGSKVSVTGTIQFYMDRVEDIRIPVF